MKWRIKSLVFVFVALYLFLVYCLYGIQIKKSAYYKEQAQRQASGVFQAPRGGIFFIENHWTSETSVAALSFIFSEFIKDI